MRVGGVFLFAAGNGRHADGTHEVNLRGAVALADIHPKAGNAGNRWPPGVGLQTQHVVVEGARLFNVVVFLADTDAVMMQFKNLDGHGRSPYAKGESVRVVLPTAALRALFCMRRGWETSYSTPPPY